MGNVAGDEKAHQRKKTMAIIGWGSVVLLMPLTIVLLSGTTNLVLLGVWIFLACVALLYALINEFSSQKTASELVQAHHDTDTEKSQLDTILNSMTVGIMSISTDGTIRLYNSALLALLDTNVSLTDKNISNVFTTFDCSTQEPLDLLSIAQNTYLTRNEDVCLHYADGDQVRLGVTVNAVRGANDQLEGYIYIIEDITKQKSLEEERDEFISVISHELRTPIAIAEGSISNAQFMLERKAKPDAVKKTFDEAHQQIVFLANMVNDLGTLSRAERGVGDQTEAINIDQMAADMHAKYGPKAAENNLHFNLDVIGKIGEVTTSRLYLEEMLQNFITNSIKYTQKGSVTLRIARTDSGVQFDVKDTGIGISKTDQKHVFDKFYRSEDYRTRETSGTGLGLYVVQKLSRKLGTTVTVTSRLNHGSTFSFTLPIRH